MGFMSNYAMEKLWSVFDRLKNAEIEYWFTASKLLDEGSVNVEDIANVYGVHTDTARKRLRNWRESFGARTDTPSAPFPEA